MKWVDIRRADRALLSILAVALVLRAAIAWWPPIHHADEVWQYLEPARALFGDRWIETWEYRAGARSWLMPGIFAPAVAIGQALAPGTMLETVLPRLMCALLATGGVAAAAGLGWRVSRAHGLVAGFVAAIWYEAVYFGPRTLSEPIAVSLMLIAAWLLTAARRRRDLAAGLALGFAAMVRFHYAPAAAILVLVAVGRDWRRWPAIILGGVLALGISVLVDMLVGGSAPFGWILRNFSLNIVDNRSAQFGVEPAWWYLEAIWRLWGWATLPILALALAGARRYPALLAAAVLNLAIHMAVPHKEYRFILLTTLFLVTLAAIGSVDLAQRWRDRRWTLPAIGAAWLATSILCGALGSSAATWGNYGRLIAAWSAAGHSNACAVGIYATRQWPVASYAMFHHNVPIYHFDAGQAAAGRASRAFNVAIAPESRGGELPGFRMVHCDARVREFCVYRRPGGCAPTSADLAHEANQLFIRKNQ